MRELISPGNPQWRGRARHFSTDSGAEKKNTPHKNPPPPFVFFLPFSRRNDALSNQRFGIVFYCDMPRNVETVVFFNKGEGEKGGKIYRMVLFESAS